MAFRTILKYPDRRLRKKSQPVEEGEDVAILVSDLVDTLKVANGVGLSGPQIGFHKRVIYVKTPELVTEMINPEIIESSCPKDMREGCLSFPGVYQNVKRNTLVTVRYITLAGEVREEKLSGLPAQVVQREIEHLDGKLMVDHMSRLKKQIISRKIAKAQRQVSKILFAAEESEPKRVKKDTHLSVKERKKRRQRRKRNRQ